MVVYNQLKHPILYCMDMIHRHMHAGKTPHTLKKKLAHSSKLQNVLQHEKKKKQAGKISSPPANVHMHTLSSTTEISDAVK